MTNGAGTSPGSQTLSPGGTARPAQDPYLLFELRREKELASLRADAEALHAELADCKSNWLDAEQRVCEHKERAADEASMHATALARVAEHEEREERTVGLLREECARRKEVDSKLVEAEVQISELERKLSRQDGQMQVLAVSIHDLSQQESLLQVRRAKGLGLRFGAGFRGYCLGTAQWPPNLASPQLHSYKKVEHGPTSQYGSSRALFTGAAATRLGVSEPVQYRT